MKKIEKIYLFKNEKNLINSMYVIYDDFSSRKYSVRKGFKKIVKKKIDDFKLQEHKSKETLIQQGRLEITNISKKSLKKFNNILAQGNSYHRGYCMEKIVASTSFLSSIFSIIFNNCFVFNFPIINVFTLSSYASFLLPMYAKELTQIEKEYLLPEKRKDYFRKIKPLVVCTLISTIDAINLPNVSTWPYYYEITHTNIEDTGNYENLTKEEYHKQAIDTIFNNLHNNPYLSERDLNILLNLEEYYMENPYLDYNSVFQNMLTVRIFERYNLGSYAAGAHDENNNIIYYYPNSYGIAEHSDILEHEAIHMTGSLKNPILNEGMTSLIQMEYYNNGVQVDNYSRQVLVTKVFCELIGSNIMLEAYSTKNDDLIYQALMNIYGDKDKIDHIYQLMNIYVYSENSIKANNSGIEFVSEVLANVPEEMVHDVTQRVFSIPDDKAYFSSNYANYLSSKQKVKVNGNN